MNRQDTVNAIARHGNFDPKVVMGVLLSLQEVVIQTLKKGSFINLTGFAKISVSKRKARRGVNPQTGKAMTIPARKVVRFAMGSQLKRAVR